ncbi:MAG: hypothetical protein M3376_14185 [Actinomycetota bacterium]|nr:hypothetical protein [Actinomycetota bacterium]
MLVVLGLLLAVTAVVFALLDPGGVVDSQGVGGVLLFLAFPGSVFFAVGSVLALRRAENAVGWLCLTIGVLWLLLGAQNASSIWAANSGRLELAEWLNVGPGWVPPVGLMGTHLLLRLPDGSLPSSRWRWYSRWCTGVVFCVFVLIATESAEPNAPLGVENPIAIGGLEPLAPLFILLPLSFLGAIASLVVRYRRSHGVERLQLRWIAFGGLVCVGWYVASLPFQLTFGSEDGTADAVLSTLTLVAYAAIPVTIAVAVLRLRLYDIDVVINRTLVYGALTATLAATYLGSVLLMQLVFSGVTANNSLAVAVSTLAVAGLFRPARGRIQATVDRRFYRNRYDAARTLAAFGAHARDEVDLDRLGGELRTVVADTMQPAHVTLWLRGHER